MKDPPFASCVLSLPIFLNFSIIFFKIPSGQPVLDTLLNLRPPGLRVVDTLLNLEPPGLRVVDTLLNLGPPGLRVVDNLLNLGPLDYELWTPY